MNTTRRGFFQGILACFAIGLIPCRNVIKTRMIPLDIQDVLHDIMIKEIMRDIDREIINEWSYRVGEPLDWNKEVVKPNPDREAINPVLRIDWSLDGGVSDVK